VGTIRRECLDFLIPLHERHLRGILKEGGNTLQPEPPTLEPGAAVS